MKYRIVHKTNGLGESWYQIQYRQFLIWWQLKIHGYYENYSSFPEAQGILDRHITKTTKELMEKTLRKQIQTKVMPYGEN